eukprot:scaffold952_cov409-Prasinococcus_capsulatus_cf.AAC.54
MTLHRDAHTHPPRPRRGRRSLGCVIRGARIAPLSRRRDASAGGAPRRDRWRARHVRRTPAAGSRAAAAAAAAAAATAATAATAAAAAAAGAASRPRPRRRRATRIKGSARRPPPRQLLARSLADPRARPAVAWHGELAPRPARCRRAPGRLRALGGGEGSRRSSCLENSYFAAKGCEQHRRRGPGDIVPFKLFGTKQSRLQPCMLSGWCKS